MKKLILSVAVVGTALMGHGVEAQKVGIKKIPETYESYTLKERGPLVFQDSPDGDAAFLQYRSDILKDLQKINKELEDEDARSINDTVQHAIADERLNQEINANLKAIADLEAEISRQQKSAATPIACTLADKKLEAQLQEQINIFTTHVRKRDRFKAYVKSTWSRLKTRCGK